MVSTLDVVECKQAFRAGERGGEEAREGGKESVKDLID